MMFKQIKLLIPFILIASLLTTALIACGPAQPPAQDDSKGTLKVGWLTDITGPIASSCVPQMESGQDYTDFINAQGGVLGHPIEMILVDTRYSNDLAVAGFEKMATQDNVLMVGAVSANFLSVCKPLANRYKIPLAAPTEYGAVLPVTSDSYIFGNGPAYADYYRSGMYWIKENWKKADPPRFAIMGVDLAFSKSNLKGVKWMLENEFKWPIVKEEWMSISSTSATSQVTNIKNAKPDYVILCSTGNPQIMFHKEAKAQGLTESTIILDTFLSSIPMFRAADIEAMTGVINFIPVALYPQMVDDAPYLTTVAQIHKKARFGKPLDWVRIGAYANMIGTVDIFEKALNKYGYKNLDGEKIKWIEENAMAGSTSKGLAPPSEWSSTGHITSHNCIIARTTDSFDVEILYKWYKMPPWPSQAGDPVFWAQ